MSVIEAVLNCCSKLDLKLLDTKLVNANETVADLARDVSKLCEIVAKKYRNYLKN